MKKAVSTDKAPSAPSIYSQAIENGNLVFLSGQVHLTPDGELVEGSFKDKVDQIMNNLQTVLEEAELGFEDVVKVTVFLTNMEDYQRFNEIYVQYFDEPFPAREAVCVKALPLGAIIEISMIASK
ncbi:hypothetical protein GF362_01050 [Candidatus Dojkabacteria bacterium]|nr:hypothetical protein [Candidatus Dojkabacteria bacterium]